MDGVVDLGDQSGWPVDGVGSRGVRVRQPRPCLFPVGFEHRLSEAQIEAAYPGLIGSLVDAPRRWPRDGSFGPRRAARRRSGRYGRRDPRRRAMLPAWTRWRCTADTQFSRCKRLDASRATGDLVLLQHVRAGHGRDRSVRGAGRLARRPRWRPDGAVPAPLRTSGRWSEPLVGAPAVHRQSRRWLTAIGIGRRHRIAEAVQAVRRKASNVRPSASRWTDVQELSSWA